MDISQNNGAGAHPAEEQVWRKEEAAAGGNLVEGDPSASCLAPQASTQAAQNIAQGDNATPLETGLRQRGNVKSQRAAEAKAACDTALAAFNRERRQERLRTAQELVNCLSSGMDLLSIEQIGQIKEAAAAAGNEPWEALRSFRERLRARLTSKRRSRGRAGDNRQGERAAAATDTQRVAAESETPRDTTRLPETRRMTCQDVPGPPSGRMLRGAESEVEQMHNYISRIGCNLHEAIRSRDAPPRISSGVTTGLCIRGSPHARDDQQKGWCTRLGPRGGRLHDAGGGRVHGDAAARG
jgi:hypothetical protein